MEYKPNTNNTLAPAQLLEGWLRIISPTEEIQYSKMLNHQWITVSVGTVYDEKIAIPLLQAMDKKAEKWRSFYLSQGIDYPIWSEPKKIKWPTD